MSFGRINIRTVDLHEILQIFHMNLTAKLFSIV
jgi:hypothetical protein